VIAPKLSGLAESRKWLLPLQSDGRMQMQLHPAPQRKPTNLIFPAPVIRQNPPNGLPGGQKVGYRLCYLLFAMTTPDTGVPGVSIVIPAWNEEDRLARTLERYLPSLEARGDPFEVLVVVDGVRDRTAEVAARYENRHVRVLRFPSKLGKGGAILAGVRVSRFEYVGYLDADGPISPEEMYGLVDYLRDVDCVVASRWIRGASGVNAEPLFNRVAGRCWNVLTRSLLFLPLRDTQAGAKFFKGPVVRSLLRSVTVTNRAFDVDFLYHVRKNGHSVREVPVHWTHDAATRMPIGRAIPVMFASLVGVRVMNSPVGKRVPPKLVQWFLSQFGGS
jgi:dolichol-phosphate mannosyltransferase